MGKIQYLSNFFYSTAKTIFRLYLCDGGDLQNAGLLLQKMHTLLDDVYHESVREVSAAMSLFGGMESPEPKEPPKQQPPQENQDFPPGFSQN